VKMGVNKLNGLDMFAVLVCVRLMQLKTSYHKMVRLYIIIKLVLFVHGGYVCICLRSYVILILCL